MTDEARAFLAARSEPVRMVIFDCDGVLIYSEALCNRVESARLTELGWVIAPAECHARFLGFSFYDMVPSIEAQLGRPEGNAWMHDILVRLTAILAVESQPIPGAWEALIGVAALGLPWRIASNSSYLVVEDSAAGTQAARAAGMARLGYSPSHHGATLRKAGAIPFRTMHAIPNMLGGIR
jgi:beta-phosphoglucomutase-like phosphatase (HAD superfamily)